MDSLFSKLQNKEDSKSATSHNENPTKEHHQPSNAELMASAKCVAEAGTATFSKESDKVDKAKVAGAAENLVAAGSKYGNLEENKYVDKAKDYLHQYHSSHSTAQTDTSGHSAQGGRDSSSVPSGGGGDEKSGGGYGDYLKTAQGFLNK